MPQGYINIINYHLMFKLHIKANYQLLGRWGEKKEDVGVKGGENNNDTVFKHFVKALPSKAALGTAACGGLCPTLRGSALRTAPSVGTQEATLLLPACCRDAAEALKWQCEERVLKAEAEFPAHTFS